METRLPRWGVPTLHHARLPLALAGGLPFFSLLALVPAHDKAEAFRQLSRTTAWSAWFLVLLAAGSAHPPLWRILRKWAVASAILAGGFAVARYWGPGVSGSGPPAWPAGLPGDRHLIGAFHVLLSPWILWALIEERGWQRASAGVAWLLGGYVLAIAHSRAAWLGAGVMGVAVVSLLLARGRATLSEVGNRRRILLFALLPLAAAVLLPGAARPYDDPRGGRPGRLADLAAAETLMEPRGLGVLADPGTPGGLCWMGIQAAALIAGFRSFRSQGHPALGFPILLLTSGLAGFAAICALDFPRERPGHMAWYAASLAALFSLAGGGRDRPARPL